MSTHNIGFYEDLTKISFELSTNIIKYAPFSPAAWVIMVDMIVTETLFFTYANSQHVYNSQHSPMA